MSETAIQARPTAFALELNESEIGTLYKLAETFARSSMVPKDYIGKPENCFVGMMHGRMLGFGALAALQNIANINGRPSLFGDALPGLIKIHPEFEDMEETWPDDQSARCVIKRKGQKPVIRTFTVVMAKQAKLWGKAGPWTQYPERMLQMRARSWAIRDSFPDALCGLGIVEEERDIPIRVEAKVSDPGKGTAGLKKLLTEEAEPAVEPKVVEAQVIKPADPPFEDNDIKPEVVVEVVDPVPPPTSPPTNEEPEGVEKDEALQDRKALIAAVYKRGKPVIKAKTRDEFWAAVSAEEYLGREVQKVQQVTTEELALLYEMFKEA